MNKQVLGRRLFYIAAMVLLLFPIYLLGNPSVRNSTGAELTPGGALAKIRTKYELGQADLGAIDPASESMRLATLGLRGVAVSILWQRAEYFKREQFWDNYSAALNQITRLEPHFVKVWDFLSWNLSYNISIEFDDYRQRYAWVKKGIDYLLVGTKYNKAKTDLPYELGWKFGNKFGVSDEKVQFRALYRKDADWHEELATKGMDVRSSEGLGPDSQPDSWLSGKMWYDRCYAMVDGGALACRGPTNFYRMGPMWQINFAQAIATDGYLRDPAKFAWIKSAEQWNRYGNRIMRSTWGEDLKMNDIEQANKKVAEAKAALMDFCKEKAQSMREERMNLLTEAQAEALKIPDLERTAAQVFSAMEAENKLNVPYKDLAAAMPPEKQARAAELALKVTEAETFVTHVEVYRNQVNYQYWDMRCTAEQTEDALEARAALYEANKLLDDAQLDGAMAKFMIAFNRWNDLFNRFPAMMTDESAEEVSKAIKLYRERSDNGLPSDFVLNDFIRFREEYEATGSDPRLTQILNDWGKIDRGAYFDRFRKLRAEEASRAAAAAEPAKEEASKEPEKSEPAKNEVKPAPAADKPAEPAKSSDAKSNDAKSDGAKAALPDAGDAPAPVAKPATAASKPDEASNSNEPPPVPNPEAPSFGTPPK